MVQQVREIMTENPVVVSPLTSVVDVAQLMRSEDIGTVLVVDDDQLRGLGRGEHACSAKAVERATGTA